MNFTVAHTEKFRDSSGTQKDKTIWVECAYWSDRTAVAPYLRKGTQVYFEGTPEVRTYPKNDGTTGVSLSLRVQSVQLLGSRGDSSNSGSDNSYDSGNYRSAAASSVPGGAADSSEAVDDLPF